MKSSQFSIIVGESTDRSDTKLLAIVVRISGLDEFLRLLEVKSGTARALYDSVKNYLDSKEVPLLIHRWG